MKDFPKLDCDVLTAPKLNEQVKEHFKMKDKGSPLWVREFIVQVAGADV